MGREAELEAVIRLMKLASEWGVVAVSPSDDRLQVTSARATSNGGTMAVEYLEGVDNDDIQELISGLEMEKIVFANIPEMSIEGEYSEGTVNFDAAPALFAFWKSGANEVLGRTFQDICVGVLGEGACMAGEALLEAEGIESEVSGGFDGSVFLEWVDRLERSTNVEVASCGKNLRQFYEDVRTTALAEDGDCEASEPSM